MSSESWRKSRVCSVSLSEDISLSYIHVGYGEDGKQKRKTVYGKTQREVREEMDAIKGKLAAGTYNDNHLTVGAYLDEWLSYKKLEVKARSYQYYADYVRRYVRPQVGRVKLANLKPLHVQRMMKETTDGVSADAANKAHGVLKSALKRAVRLGLIYSNPVEAVDKFKHEPKEAKLWSAEEVWRFLETAQKHRLYAAFYLALTTGMRHGEVLGLRWQDVEGDVLTVWQSVVNVKGARYEVSTPKTRRGVRRVALDPDTLDVLREHRAKQDAEREYLGDAWEDSGHVFTNELGGVLFPRNFDRVWYALQEQAGVTRVRFHDLRHLHVSLLVVERGLDARTVADRVGHTDPSFTLKRYSHMFEKQRKAATVSLKELLGEGEEE